jgi:hypothetical protein
VQPQIPRKFRVEGGYQDLALPGYAMILSSRTPGPPPLLRPGQYRGPDKNPREGPIPQKRQVHVFFKTFPLAAKSVADHHRIHKPRSCCSGHSATSRPGAPGRHRCPYGQVFSVNSSMGSLMANFSIRRPMVVLSPPGMINPLTVKVFRAADPDTFHAAGFQHVQVFRNGPLEGQYTNFHWVVLPAPFLHTVFGLNVAISSPAWPLPTPGILWPGLPDCRSGRWLPRWPGPGLPGLWT